MHRTRYLGLIAISVFLLGLKDKPHSDTLPYGVGVVPPISSESPAGKWLASMEGHWGLEKYVQEIDLRRLGKMRMVRPGYCRFQKHSGERWVLFETNFHEGPSYGIKEITFIDGMVYLYSTTGTVFKFAGARQDKKGKVQRFQFIGGEWGNEFFIRLDGGLAELAKKKLFEGTYKDTQSQVYRFTSDGRAEWPKESFAYELSMSGFFDKCDVFYHINEKYERVISYGYKWKDNQLLLLKTFQTDGGETISCELTPFARLTPQN